MHGRCCLLGTLQGQACAKHALEQLNLNIDTSQTPDLVLGTNFNMMHICSAMAMGSEEVGAFAPVVCVLELNDITSERRVKGCLTSDESYEMNHLLFFLFGGFVSAIKFTDSLLAPVPADHYSRYVTFLAVGDRTYTCDPANKTSTYSLKSFDYDMYDAELDPQRRFNLGKHVLMLQRDAQGGNSVFYTANNTFTYW